MELIRGWYGVATALVWSKDSVGGVIFGMHAVNIQGAGWGVLLFVNLV